MLIPWKESYDQPRFGSVQSLSHVWLFATPWLAARQASITNSRSSPRLMYIKSVMPSSHLILCHPLLLLPPIPPRIRVFSNVSILHMRYWNFSLSISPSNEHPGLVSFRMDWLISLQSKALSRVFSNTTLQKHQFFGTWLSSQSNSHIHTWPQGKFWKRWEYQTTLPASWKTCMCVKKQQLEPCMEQLTGSVLRKQYNKAVYYHPVYLTYMQSTSC